MTLTTLRFITTDENPEQLILSYLTSQSLTQEVKDRDGNDVTVPVDGVEYFIIRNSIPDGDIVYDKESNMYLQPMKELGYLINVYTREPFKEKTVAVGGEAKQELLALDTAIISRYPDAKAIASKQVQAGLIQLEEEPKYPKLKRFGE